MNQTELKKLRDSDKRGLERWKARGRRTTHYTCGHCDLQVEIRRPRKRDVADGKGCWDSCMTCVLCGGLSFVVVYPDGTTITTVIPTATAS